MGFFIGSIIDSLLLMAAGIYLQFFWNKKVPKNKASAYLGWLLIVIGLLLLVTHCIDYFS
jgi:membrane protein DedA with SNARE-associated domain